MKLKTLKIINYILNEFHKKLNRKQLIIYENKKI